MNNKKSLVTFVLFAYNQEKYIRKAINGALCQHYSPLEIIISDDCSSDNTFEIMKEMVNAYDGHHKVFLNKNNRNLGFAEHLNLIMRTVRSDFVVIAAGDDISDPYRTDELVKVWINSNKKILSIHSMAIKIDDQDNEIGIVKSCWSDEVLNNPVAHAKRHIGVLGATHGFDMKLIREFPPLFSKVANEDNVLSSRAALINPCSVQIVNKTLVKYRKGVGISGEAIRRRELNLYSMSDDQLKKVYYCFLQKSCDIKFKKLQNKYGKYVNIGRAKSFFPIWLRNRSYSYKKINFFIRRCPLFYLLYEWIKYKFPFAVKLKQIIQFKLKNCMS